MIAVSTLVIVVCVIAIVVGLVLFVFARRRPAREQGVESFRRHIDALSPSAREEMKKHARPSDPEKKD